MILAKAKGKLVRDRLANAASARLQELLDTHGVDDRRRMNVAKVQSD